MLKSLIEECFSDVEALQHDHIFVSFLANKDREGREFNIKPWETKALKLQGRLFGGATSYPSRGSYRRKYKEPSGVVDDGVIIEETKMIVSFICKKDMTKKALKEISDFLGEFGRKTNQESVAFVIDGEMYYMDIPKSNK